MGSAEEMADHPMRHVTRQVAFEPDGWTPARAAKVAALFDGLAPQWHTRLTEGRVETVADALDRGGVTGTSCVELGSGTGFATASLAARFDVVVACDLSSAMLRLAPPVAPRVQADAARLPLRDGVADVVTLVNMLLFPSEVDRVLAPGGAVVWVNSLGDRTPIHLPAPDVLAALGPGWTGVASGYGRGTWCVARRSGAGVSAGDGPDGSAAGATADAGGPPPPA